MAVTLPVSVVEGRIGRRYLRPPVPLHFPEEEKVPEGAFHDLLRALLADSVRYAFWERAQICSNQFLYWDRGNPKRCLAPDLAVRYGSRSEVLGSWKVWEMGAPHVVVEITSDSDRPAAKLRDRLRGYQQAGVLEVVCFDHENQSTPLRIWDLFDGDLVERDPEGPKAFACDTLGLFWCVKHSSELGATLRLARDPEGLDLLPSGEEAERAAKDAALAAKDAALARVAELEAEVARRR
jgi:hypothetical protein